MDIWYIYTTENDSGIYRNKFLAYATVCMNLKNIVAAWKKPDTRKYILSGFIYLSS